MTDPQWPPPPNYPPTVGMPVQWWQQPEQAAPLEPAPVHVTIEAPGPEQHGRFWSQFHIAYNAPTLAAGCFAAPLWHRALIIAGNQYGFALAAIAAALLADRWRRRWYTRTLLWAVVAGAALDLPVLDQMLRILTGVPL